MNMEPFHSEELWFLQHFLVCLCLQSGAGIVMILDNARIHHAKLLEAFLEQNSGRLTLMFLPPGVLTEPCKRHNRSSGGYTIDAA